MAFVHPKQGSLQESIIGKIMSQSKPDFSFLPTNYQPIQDIHKQWQTDTFKELPGKIDTFVFFPCDKCQWHTFYCPTDPQHYAMRPFNSICTSCNNIAHCGVYGCGVVVQKAEYCKKHTINALYQ